MLLQNWSDVLVTSFQNLWEDIIAYVPNILVSIIIFVVGWVFASLIGKWIASLIRSLKIDTALQSLGIQDLVNRAGYRLDSGAFIGAIVNIASSAHQLLVKENLTIGLNTAACVLVSFLMKATFLHTFHPRMMANYNFCAINYCSVC